MMFLIAVSDKMLHIFVSCTLQLQSQYFLLFKVCHCAYFEESFLLFFSDNSILTSIPIHFGSDPHFGTICFYKVE